MRQVAFAKANSCGNDFLIIEQQQMPPEAAAFTRAICHRHTGVGADGIEWITAGAEAHEVTARLINADGSEAEISGNGTRCVAAYWIFRNGGNRVSVHTGAGRKDCFLMQHSGLRYEFETEMGTGQVLEELEVAGRAGMRVSTGNPHFVTFVESFEFPWQSEGMEIQSNRSVFPQGTNVEFVRLMDGHTIECRFYERGAGETQSSGTGSCASALAAIHKGLVKSPVSVLSPGGKQRVRLEKGVLHLEGPAEIVCEGEFFYAA